MVIALLAAHAASAVTFSWTGSVAIPDDGYNGTLGSMATVNVPVSGVGQSPTVENVKLRFDGTNCDHAAAPYSAGLAHTWVGDLTVKLIAPDGTVVTLVSRMGLAETADTGSDSGTGLNADDFCGTLFETGGAKDIETASAADAPFTGSYAPNRGAAVAGNLTAFAGKAPNGTWKLAVGDSASGDTGTIKAFSLIINSTVTTPLVVITPGPGITAGQSTSASAQVYNRSNPVASTVTFKLYGPADTTCSGSPLFSDTVAYPATGGLIAGPAHTAANAGTNHWTATYDGDASNPASTSTCSEGAVAVAKASPAIAGTSSAGGEVGTHVTDMATVSGRVSPVDGATVDFRLFGPDDAACSGAPALESLGRPVDSAGNATSGEVAPTTAGTYRWVATYSGDADNSGAATACGADGQSVVVTAPGSGTTTPPTTTTPAAPDTSTPEQTTSTPTSTTSTDAGTKPPAIVLASACASKRRFSVRLSALKPHGVSLRGARITKASITRAGKAIRRLSHSAQRVTVDLRGLPKGTTTVSLTVRLANGQTRVLTRRYRQCAQRHR